MQNGVTIRKALSIAGSDSSGGAGVQADLKTFAAHGVYGLCAITAITAQNTLGVSAIQPVSSDMVSAQIEAVVGDIGVDVVKTGMLADAAIVEVVAAAVRTLDMPNLVVDPVMVAKSGHRLLSAEAVATVRTELFPLALVATPNVFEAEMLSGLRIRSIDEAKAAAERIHAQGPRYVIVKGGHVEGREAIDTLFDGHEFTLLRAPRLDSVNTHGTGCTFASAIAANLALGFDLKEAAGRAKVYVTEAIRRGLAIGQGHGVLHHFYNWR